MLIRRELMFHNDRCGVWRKCDGCITIDVFQDLPEYARFEIKLPKYHPFEYDTTDHINETLKNKRNSLRFHVNVRGNTICGMSEIFKLEDRGRDRHPVVRGFDSTTRVVARRSIHRLVDPPSKYDLRARLEQIERELREVVAIKTCYI